jgi:hypothetical protein
MEKRRVRDKNLLSNEGKKSEIKRNKQMERDGG